jgi:hypothetical protein
MARATKSKPIPMIHRARLLIRRVEGSRCPSVLIASSRDYGVLRKWSALNLFEHPILH